jgi:hypothetical protein
VNPRLLVFRRDGGVRAPWRVGFFLFASWGAGMLALGLAYPLLGPLGVVDWARQANVPLDQWGLVVALLVGTYATLRIVDGVRDATWARIDFGARALRWTALVVGLLAGSLAILVPSAVLMAGGWLRTAPEPSTMSWAEGARLVLMALVPAALVEELALRGIVLSALRDDIGAAGAVALTSVLFALLHLFNPGPTVLSTAVVALAGVFLGTVRLATGSLHAAWIAHLAWNFSQAAVLHAPVSGLVLPTPGYRMQSHGPDWLTGGAWGPEGGLAAAAGMLLCTFLLVWRPSARTSTTGES